MCAGIRGPRFALPRGSGQISETAEVLSGVNMSEQQVQPLVVPVKEARRLLGSIGRNKFWEIVKAGEMELVGSERKRFVVTESIHACVERMRQAARKSKAQS
jgi:hypothetical protein